MSYRFTVRIDLGEVSDVTGADGTTGRVTPVTGGSCSGQLTGRVLPAGANWSRRIGGTARLDARHLIDSDTHGIIEVRTSGCYRLDEQELEGAETPDGLERPGRYFRVTSEFDSADENLAWLTENLFIGRAESIEGGIAIHYFSVG
ncbi:DUF3237 domain-containing protein [Arthrobacter sp. S2(2024)]|jgi:hypothetical protein|uniref:DUF3237 domain-containing protein n=1 Tax=Arthrobacter sp. S2(2024) TaxID=3111911 RepID=UPI002FCB6DEB